jgi:hypothetical protein
MRDFFASLYEWFGLNSLYSTDLGEHLRGYDITCSDYLDTPLYVMVGLSMIFSTIIIYILLYYVINSPRWNKRAHWWIFAGVLVSINFLIAFTPPFNDLQTTDYCTQLRISALDCVFFGVSNAIWSFILFAILTSSPIRKWAGHNMTDTTFWKPKS